MNKQIKQRSGRGGTPGGTGIYVQHRVMFRVHESNFGYKITVVSVFLTVQQRNHLLNTQQTIKNFKSC